MPVDQKKASAKVIDMTNVADGGGGRFNTKRLPEGDYLARITKVEDAEVKSGDNKGDFQWLFTIVPEKHQSHKYPYYCKLTENQLWKIRNLLVAAGMTVPKKKVKLDPEKVVGKLIAISLEDDEYDGKAKSVIGTIFPASELTDVVSDDSDDDDDDDDTTPAAAQDDEDEEMPGTWSDIANLDRAGLKAYNTENELGVKVLKSMSDDDLRTAVAEAAGITIPQQIDDEEEEDEDDEEEAAPVAKKRTKRKAVTDDELEELDIDDV